MCVWWRCGLLAAAVVGASLDRDTGTRTDGFRIGGSPRAAAQAGVSSSSGGPSIGRIDGINDVNVVVAGTGANGNAEVNDGTNAVQQLCGRRQQQ